MSADVTLGFVLVATSVASALLALMILTAATALGRRRRTLAETPPVLEEAVFLFDDRALVDATGPARALIEAMPAGDSDWARLTAYAAPRFEDFAARMAALAAEGRVELSARDGAPLRLVAEMAGGLARITLADLSAEGQGVMVDALSQRAAEEEMANLRATLDALPAPVWRQDAAGAVVWANRAYLALADDADGDEAMTWPLPALFDMGPAPAASPQRRLKLDRAAPGEPPRWFDCHSAASGAGSLHFALPADATVRAEQALRDFVQTLTKTFAHLPIGLAVFDRGRRLALFNPALTDLTTLGAEFLTARPTLLAFLDRLREARMMPEPKDYRSWRQQMAELETAAASGQYQETWTLPTGQTYRVTGRPHPDGAVAFLIEDISAEMSLTRRFRSDLRLGQAVVDSLEEAIAVFSPAGVLVLSNAAYARLWGVDPSTALGEIGVTEAMRHWQAAALPNPVWAEARDFIAEIGERADWTDEAMLKDGRRLACRFAALAGGATLVAFAVLSPAPPPGLPRGDAAPERAAEPA